MDSMHIREQAVTRMTVNINITGMDLFLNVHLNTMSNNMQLFNSVSDTFFSDVWSVPIKFVFYYWLNNLFKITYIYIYIYYK